MSLSTLLKNEALYHYILDNTLNMQPVQEQMLNQAKNDELSEMITAPDQLQFLQMLMKMISAKKVIEVGVFRGVGTLALALALPDDGQIYACDVDDSNLEEYKKYWHEAKVNQKIKLEIAPAIKTLTNLIEYGHSDSFDFVYIDADKSEYYEYYNLSYKLIRKGGLVVLDNMLRGGKVIDASINTPSIEATRAINKFIKADKRVESILTPIGDGLTIVRKI
ncbi:O-methyltransferase [Cysteiniphilum sp. 6C5]|uniref:O-methyltransferase n=1 Tax=unclassified Cysteiniphilum TaxID=2610889 RepID=UPI003F84F2FE